MLIKNARLSFPQLWTPSAFDEGQEARYQATLLIPNGDPQIEKLRAYADQVGQEKWGAKWAALKHSVKHRYLRDGVEKAAQYDGFEGHQFITANRRASQGAPEVVDLNPHVHLTEADGRPYGGCYVNAVIDLWGQDNKWGKAINATLYKVQFAGDGDSFGGGRAAPPDEFDDLSDDRGDDPLA